MNKKVLIVSSLVVAVALLATGAFAYFAAVATATQAILQPVL